MQNNQTKRTVVVGMSGGIDSSVVALLLKKQGFNVVGLHMQSENLETRDADEKRVKDICNKIDIDCHVVKYDSQMQNVKDYFIKGK